MAALQHLIDQDHPQLESSIVCEVRFGQRRFPIHALTLGNASAELPAVGFFGGIHGLEQISEIVAGW